VRGACCSGESVIREGRSVRQVRVVLCELGSTTNSPLQHAPLTVCVGTTNME
jgi:hypothetical protein